MATSPKQPRPRGRSDAALFPSRPDEIVGLRELISNGASEDEIYAQLLESQCGATDDSQAVERYDGTLGVPAAFVAANQSAVGQVQWNNNLAAIYTNPGDVSGVRWGSGTLISNNLFLTAGHLFDQDADGWSLPKQNGTTNVIPPTEIATNMHVNFNYQVDPNGVLRTEQSFPITGMVEYRMDGLDFAIVQLGGNPGATFGVTPVSTTDAAINDMICIIGHPDGRPKRIEAGPTTVLNGSTIGYNDIDTLGGNSGSGILHADTAMLVGVHTQGGCTRTGGHNSGVRITSIIAKSPTLQAITAATPDHFNAIWVRDNVDWDFVYGWAREHFDSAFADKDAQGYRPIDLNTFVLPGVGDLWNAVWVRDNADWDFVYGWAREHFDSAFADKRAQGYRPVTINAFMVPGVGDLWNAVWVRDNADWDFVYGWAREHFDVREAERRAQGYRLVDLNAFVLPGVGELYNAVWVKNNEDQRAVWGWAREHFDAMNNDLHAQGYRFAKANTFVLPGVGELYNGIWVRNNEDRQFVYGWARAHFDVAFVDMQAAGYRPIDLNAFVLP